MISSGLWRREYGASQEVLGKPIWINSKEFTIVGVAPPAVDEINGFGKPEIYLPRMMEGLFGNEVTLTDRTARRLQLFARLRDGIAIGEARAEIGRIASQLEQEYPESNRGQRMTVYTQLGYRMANSPESFAAAGLFFIVSGLVLIIATVNVTNLILSMAPARTRDLAIRAAMGATRARLVRQMLIESVCFSTGGTFFGLIIAALSARFITSIELFANTPFKLDIQVDTRVALFALLVGVAAGLLSGLPAAIRCSRGDLNSLLKSGDIRVARVEGMRIRQAVVIVQVAVAMVVLFICGFSIQRLTYLVVVILSVAVTAFACNLPARRASIVDPNVVLRSE